MWIENCSHGSLPTFCCFSFEKSDQSWKRETLKYGLIEDSTNGLNWRILKWLTLFSPGICQVTLNNPFLPIKLVNIQRSKIPHNMMCVIMTLSWLTAIYDLGWSLKPSNKMMQQAKIQDRAASQETRSECKSREKTLFYRQDWPFTARC